MENFATFLPGDSPPPLPPIILCSVWFPLLTCDCILNPAQVTAPYLHVGGVLLMTALAWPIALHFFRMNSRGELHVCVPHLILIKVVVMLNQLSVDCINVELFWEIH